MIKTMNTLAANWFVDYFSKPEVGLEDNARLLEISWAISLFLGGISCAIYNQKLSNSIFALQLLMSSLFFLILQTMDNHPDFWSVLVMVVCAGFSFGGPYYLIATAVPLMMGEKEGIRNR